MKNILSTVFFFCFTFNSSAQWQWAKQFGGLGNESGQVYMTGSDIYLAGNFQYDCNLDSDVLISNGDNDLFLAKYDLTLNNRMWLKQFGGNNSSSQRESGSVSLVTSNAIYYSGTFSGTITIDGISVNDLGSSDAFVAKFDLNGICQWIKHAGGGVGMSRTSGGVVMDSNGNLYWSIYMDENGTLDTVAISKGIVLVKLDESGTILSIKNNLITGGYILRLKIRNDELFFCGVSENDTSIIGNDTLIANDVTDCLFAKSDLVGNIIWSKRFGGSLPGDAARSFDFDSNDNIILVGNYKDTLVIDGNNVIHAGTGYDTFIARFDSNGINVWVKALQNTGIGPNYPAEICKDASGMFYITGTFSGTAQFGIFPVSTTNDYDMFLARYDANGDCQGVYNFGKAIGTTLNVNSNNDVIVTGFFENTINVGVESLTSYGLRDAFIAKADAIIGIEETGKLKNQLQIYANPNRGNFTIKVPDEVTTFENAWLLVYDSTGKQIAKFSLDGQSDQPHFDVSENGKGVYQVKLIQGNASYSGQMVIE